MITGIQEPINMKQLIFLLLVTLPFSMLNSSYAASNVTKTIEVELNSLDELMALFEKYNYTSKAWQAGSREIPRITFDNVSERWQQTSHNIPVKQKKQVFFRLMAPLVLMSNENILQERAYIKAAAANDVNLLKLADKYRINRENKEQLSTSERQALLVKADIMPPSLALAQAAEESGWATSRFMVEGNAFLVNGIFPAKAWYPNNNVKS